MSSSTPLVVAACKGHQMLFTAGANHGDDDEDGDVDGEKQRSHKRDRCSP